MRAAAALSTLLGVALASGCGGAAKEPKVAEPAPVKKPAADGDRSGFAGTSVTPHHSARLGLTIPLPDRAAWQIVDLEAQQGGWLVATHGPTHTWCARVASTRSRPSSVARSASSARPSRVSSRPRSSSRSVASRP